MWIISDWWFRWRYQDIDFKIKSFTETFQSDARADIRKAITKITKKESHHWTRIQLKDAKKLMHQYWTDELGYRHRQEVPVFTEGEVAQMRGYRLLYWFFMVVLVIFEALFFSLFAGLILPQQLNFGLMYILLGLVLAVIFGFALHFSLHAIFTWYNTKKRIEKYKAEGHPKVSDTDIYPTIIPLYIAIAACVLFVVSNIAVGFARAYLIHPQGQSPVLQQAEFPLLIFSVIFPVGVALFMALAEKRLSEIRERLAVHKNWKRQHAERKRYNTAVRDMRRLCLERRAQISDHYWNLLKDVQRIFRIEVDESHKHLHQELDQELRSDKNLSDIDKIDDSFHQKYCAVAATRKELFFYPIFRDEQIAREVQDLDLIVTAIDEYEDEAKKPEEQFRDSASGAGRPGASATESTTDPLGNEVSESADGPIDTPSAA